MRETMLLVIQTLAFVALGASVLAVVGTLLFWLRYQIGHLFDVSRWHGIEAATDALSFEIGTAKSVTIRVLFEWHSNNENLISDAGMSYLIEVDGRKFLFDLGDRRWRESPSPLVHNLKALGYDPQKFVQELDALLISHPHREHMGGAIPAWTKRPGTELKFDDVPIYTPWRKERQPLLLAPGVAISAPLPGRQFIFGRVEEQMLIVNLEGRGLICILADAHPEVLPMLAYATHLTGAKPYAVVGGIHALLDDEVRLPWRWFFSRRPPWLQNRPEEIGLLGVGLQDAGVKKLLASAHDSDMISLAIMRSIFGDQLQVLAAGDVVELGAPE